MVSGKWYGCHNQRIRIQDPSNPNPLNGFDIFVFGNIPNGSGLSSSASVEVGRGTFLNDYYGFGLTPDKIALIGQYSENNFNKVNCGIMDQFAIAMGKKDNAIFLDTSDLSYTYAPLKLEGAKIVIACSNKKRGLGDSKYNERRAECEMALSELQKVPELKNLKSLGELTENEFEKSKEYGKDYYIYIVYEIRSIEPKIWKIQNPFLYGDLTMRPVQYKVSIHAKRE